MTKAAVPDGFTEAALEAVRRRTGLIFPEGRIAAFKTGLARSMDRVHLGGKCEQYRLEQYLVRLEHDAVLLDDLVGEITVGETYFFRDQQQFALIRDVIFPSLAAKRPAEQPIRVWSAGCATGEEPYSLAIAAREHVLHHAVHILATDISRTALARARRGLYSRWSLRDGLAPPMSKYFVECRGQFQLVQSIRDDVDFRYLNLAEDVYPSLAMGVSGLDLILCRNVLIYFDGATIARVAGRLLGSLGDDGWLLLGASDPVISEIVDCDVRVMEAGLAYRPKAHGAPVTQASDVSSPPTPAPIVARESPSVQAGSSTSAVALRPSAPPKREFHTEAARAKAGRDYPRASEQVRRDLDPPGDDSALWVRRVRSLANRGELEAAGQVCAAGLDRVRNSAELTYLHAVLLAEAGWFREAAEAVRCALYLDRDLIVAHLLLCHARTRLGDTDGSRRALRNAERLLVRMGPHEIVPASDGEPAHRLTEIVRAQMRLIHAPRAS